MLSKEVATLFTNIATSSVEMVQHNVEPVDLTGQIDYASIYAKSPLQYEQVSAELERKRRSST